MGDLKTNRLVVLLVWGVLSLIVVSLLTIYGFTYYSEHIKFEAYLSDLESQVLEQQKGLIKNETNRASEKVETTFTIAKEQLKSSAKAQVRSSIDVIEHLNETYSSTLPLADLKNLIKETLRPLRFFSGRGYFFIDDLDGKSILLPPFPKYEGNSFLADEFSNSYLVMMKILKVISSPEKSGFIEYQWELPGQPERTYQKISYVELFEPLGWIIGTGDYVHSYRGDSEQAILKEIDQIRFGEKGYIAVISDDGTLLKSASARQLEGMHYTEMPEVNGNAIKKIVEAAKANQDYVDYDWYVPGQINIENKLSYIKYLPFNGWILSSGIYIDDIDSTLLERRMELQGKLDRDLINLGFTFLLAGSLFAIIAYVFTRWLSSRFNAYHQVLLKKQQQLRSKTERLSLSDRIVEKAAEGIMVTDCNAEILHVNQAFSNITGYLPDEIVGHKASYLSSGKHEASFYSQLWEELGAKGQWEGEIWNRKKNGEVYPQFLRISTYFDVKGKLVNYIGTFHDLTSHKNDLQKLNYLSDFDPLTDLPNKRVLTSRLEQSLAHIARKPREKLAVIALNLDHFTRINDTLGHESGDSALAEIALRLKHSIREVDTLGRITGDEFLIILEPSDAATQIATQMAFRILEVISRRLDEAGAGLFLTCSIGITLSPDDAADAQELIKNALVAVNHAKKNGRNNFQFYKQSMTEEATHRLQIENQLNYALKNGEIKLWFQPQYHSVDLQPRSVEALIRWKKADGSFVPPSEFIPIAEESGKILEIGTWVLREACKQCSKWMSKGLEIPVSVNISAVQLQSSGFVDFVKEELDQHNLSPHLIILEVTETALMNDEDSVLDRIKRLSELGIRASLDDFGTGYSSLSLLKKARVSELKIDKSFVDGLPYDVDDKSICSSIVSVAHNLGLEVVAEGVETIDQIEALEKMGCDKFQGYYFSAAVEPSEIQTLFQSSNSLNVAVR